MASICFRSCRVSPPALASFPSAGGDPPHRPLQLRLLFQSGIGVVCLIDTLFRTGEFTLDQIAQQRLRGLPVLLIQPEQHKGCCQGNQKKQGKVIPQGVSGQEISARSCNSAQGKAGNLALSQPKSHLVLNLGQVFGNRHISQSKPSFLKT